jgi:hypothetical protein
MVYFRNAVHRSTCQTCQRVLFWSRDVKFLTYRRLLQNYLSIILNIQITYFAELFSGEFVNNLDRQEKCFHLDNF